MDDVKLTRYCKYNSNLLMEFSNKTSNKLKLNINYVPPYKGEMLKSWFDRFAKANGCVDYKDFCNTLLRLDCWDAYRYKICNNDNIELYFIFSKLGVNDWALRYLEHSGYSVTSLFMHPFAMVTLLNSVFRGIRNPITYASLSENHCPKCDKENKYLHVVHNFPGVCVCHEHKCALFNINGEPVGKVTEENIKYAEYCAKLYELKLDLSINELVKGKKSIKFKEGIKYLMKEYPNLEFPSKKNISLKYDLEYLILYKTNNIVELVHKSCDTHFCISTDGFNFGFKCPKCSLPENEIYKNNLSSDYKFINISKDIIEFKCLKCEENKRVLKKTFYNGTRCNCSIRNTYLSVKKELDNFDEFEFLDFKNGIVTFKHYICNKIYSRNYWSFKNTNIKCPECDEDALLIKKRKELVSSNGDTYVSGGLDGRNSNIKVICSNGHVFEKTFAAYKESNRCPICSKNNRINKLNLFKKEVDEKYPVDFVIFSDNDSKNKDFRYALRLGMIKKIYRGVYVRKDFSNKEILYQKYVQGKDGLIGYLCKYSFAKKIGIKVDCDNEYIATLKYSNIKFNSLIKVYGVMASFKTVPKDFSKNNYKEIELADFINDINHCNISVDKKLVNQLKKHINKNSIDMDLAHRYINDKHNSKKDYLMEALYAKKK